MNNNNIVNSVGKGLKYGRKEPYYLTTDSMHVYRTTSMDQINDIIESGYVRPKGYGSRRDRVGDRIYWSIGGEGIYYFNKSPVIESTVENVRDCQLGPIYIDDLSAIWIFDENENKYIDRLDYVKSLYEENNKENIRR